MDSPLIITYLRDLLIYINNHLKSSPTFTSYRLPHNPRIAKTVYPPDYNIHKRNYNDFQQHILSELAKYST